MLERYTQKNIELNCVIKSIKIEFKKTKTNKLIILKIIEK